MSSTLALVISLYLFLSFLFNRRVCLSLCVYMYISFSLFDFGPFFSTEMIPHRPAGLQSEDAPTVRQGGACVWTHTNLRPSLIGPGHIERGYRIRSWNDQHICPISFLLLEKFYDCNNLDLTIEWIDFFRRSRVSKLKLVLNMQKRGIRAWSRAIRIYRF